MLKKFKQYNKIYKTLLLVGIIFFILSGVSYASSTTSGQCVPPPTAKPGDTSGYCYQCGGGGNNCVDQAATTPCTSSNCDLITTYINPAINLLSGLVGVVVVIGLMIGAIEYATSAGNPQKAAKARGRMINSGIALLGFAFLYAFLQWIVPGGIFN